MFYYSRGFIFIDFKCPEKNGFFHDPEQCDLYYECIENNGSMFQMNYYLCLIFFFCSGCKIVPRWFIV
jgi:hypothetical protein